jgi:L-2-hydroxyglutarate oxidase LhgO
MNYIPQVDDYVKWREHEGWVYFKCDESISIEIGTCEKVCKEHGASFHKKNHILLVCSSFQWDELEYVKNRRNVNPDEYKSQQYRHRDP